MLRKLRTPISKCDGAPSICHTYMSLRIIMDYTSKVMTVLQWETAKGTQEVTNKSSTKAAQTFTGNSCSNVHKCTTLEFSASHQCRFPRFMTPLFVNEVSSTQKVFLSKPASRCDYRIRSRENKRDRDNGLFQAPEMIWTLTLTFQNSLTGYLWYSNLPNSTFTTS